MSELENLPNIGQTVAAQLEAVGIRTADELRRIGSREAWLRIQAIDPSACIHRLNALEGAVQGCKKSVLDPAVKAELKAFYQAHRLK